MPQRTAALSGWPYHAQWRGRLNGPSDDMTVVRGVSQCAALLDRLSAQLPQGFVASPDVPAPAGAFSVWVLSLSERDETSGPTESLRAGDRISHAPVVIACWCPPSHAWRLPLREGISLWFPEFGPDLGTVLRHLTAKPSLREFWRRLDERVDSSPVLAAALRQLSQYTVRGESVLGVRPPTPAQLARQVGCSERYLYRAMRNAGISPNGLARAATILRGLESYSHLGNWCSVALSTGFPSASAWSNYVRRAWNLTPTAAYRKGRPYWLTRALASVLSEGHDKAATEERREETAS